MCPQRSQSHPLTRCLSALDTLGLFCVCKGGHTTSSQAYRAALHQQIVKTAPLPFTSLHGTVLRHFFCVPDAGVERQSAVWADQRRPPVAATWQGQAPAWLHWQGADTGRLGPGSHRCSASYSSLLHTTHLPIVSVVISIVICTRTEQFGPPR